MKCTHAHHILTHAASVLLMLVLPAIAIAQDGGITEEGEPVITGYGEDLFKVGELLYSDDFENMDHWVPQIQETDASSEYRINLQDGQMDVLVPDRGATIWFRHKLTGPVAIVYNVAATTEYAHLDGVVPRDINSFWHASDTEVPQEVLNPNRYTGSFSTYHKQRGYYASIGGRDNTTTRFRRYPRMADDEPVAQLALSDKDEREDYLIKPDSTHTIQLVAYDDVIQYIVDGKVFYEIREGDQVTVEQADGGIDTIIYTHDHFPPYTEGWFGFRLVRTHHLYSNFRVYRLEPA